MPIAAIDLGRRRIGVAVTDAASMGAHPLGIVERRALKHDLDAIAAMLRDRHVDTIVVGPTPPQGRAKSPIRSWQCKTLLSFAW